MSDVKKQPDRSVIESSTLLESVRVAFEVMSDAPELNMSNYDHDDVALLNTAMCEAWLILNEELAKYEPDSNVKHDPPEKAGGKYETTH